MQNKIKLALIGTGGISHAHVSGILAHQDKIECVAMCDVVESNLEARAKQLGYEPKRFSDWKKMLEVMGSEIDAVDICLPHHLHAPAILDAAAAGKHILCEKPMCMTLEEADKIVDAVKKAGVIYMSAHNQLFTPAVREIKRLMDSGAVGKVRWIRSQDCFIIGNPAGMRNSWRANLKTQGGGELIDTGYHPTYRLLYLGGGDIAEVRGTMGRFWLKMEGEDTASVQVRFKNGIIRRGAELVGDEPALRYARGACGGRAGRNFWDRQHALSFADRLQDAVGEAASACGDVPRPDEVLRRLHPEGREAAARSPRRDGRCCG